MPDEIPVPVVEPAPPKTAVPAEAGPPPLPEGVKKAITLTWTRPPIVTAVDGDVLSVKQGATVQVEHRTETSFGYEKIEDEPVFKVLATQRITFAGQPLSVLNAGSMPTGAEYLSRIGTEVLTAFRCCEVLGMREAHDRAVYQTYRAWMTLV